VAQADIDGQHFEYEIIGDGFPVLRRCLP